MSVPGGDGQTIGQRVKWLVDCGFRGNVNRAARTIGIAQPTLHRIVTDDVVSPRFPAMQRISQHFGTSLDWLYHGAGAPPPTPEPPGPCPTCGCKCAPKRTSQTDEAQPPTH